MAAVSNRVNPTAPSRASSARSDRAPDRPALEKTSSSPSVVAKRFCLHPVLHIQTVLANAVAVGAQVGEPVEARRLPVSRDPVAQLSAHVGDNSHSPGGEYRPGFLDANPSEQALPSGHCIRRLDIVNEQIPIQQKVLQFDTGALVDAL